MSSTGLDNNLGISVIEVLNCVILLVSHLYFHGCILFVFAPFAFYCGRCFLADDECLVVYFC